MIQYYQCDECGYWGGSPQDLEGASCQCPNCKGKYRLTPLDACLRKGGSNTKRGSETSLGFKGVTVIFKADFMGLAVIFCKELVIEHRKYAQYSRATWLRFKEPRKRKYLVAVKGYDQQLAVFDGKVEYSNMDVVKEDGQVTVSRSKHSSFAPGWDLELQKLIEKHGVLYAQDDHGRDVTP